MEEISLNSSKNTWCKDIWEVLAHPIIFRWIFLFALKRDKNHPAYDNKDKKISFLKNAIN